MEYLKDSLKCKDDKIIYIVLLLSAYLYKKDGSKGHAKVMDTILMILLQKYTVSMVEKGECMVSISCDDINRALKLLAKYTKD